MSSSTLFIIDICMLSKLYVMCIPPLSQQSVQKMHIVKTTHVMVDLSYMRNEHGNTLVIVLLIALLVLGIGLYFSTKNGSFSNFMDSTKGFISNNIDSTNENVLEEVEKVGDVVCLPEDSLISDSAVGCRYGLRTLDGVYYELSDLKKRDLVDKQIFVDNTVTVKGNLFVYPEGEMRDTHGSIAVLGITSLKSPDGKIQDCPDEVYGGDFSNGAFIYNMNNINSDQFDTDWLIEHCDFENLVSYR